MPQTVKMRRFSIPSRHNASSAPATPNAQQKTPCRPSRQPMIAADKRAAPPRRCASATACQRVRVVRSDASACAANQRCRRNQKARRHGECGERCRPQPRASRRERQEPACRSRAAAPLNARWRQTVKGEEPAAYKHIVTRSCCNCRMMRYALFAAFDARPGNRAAKHRARCATPPPRSANPSAA